MIVGSLFSGIGGIDLGLQRAGFETVWFVENNEFCQKVLAKHWPNVPCYGNIQKVDFNGLEKVDVLAGGFPCQDISIAGKGVGINGERSGLWKEFARAIRTIRPRYAFIENVSMLARKGLNVVLADLAQAGYNAEWLDLRASDFGALHKRERIFIIAHLPSKRCNNRSNNRKKRQVLSTIKWEVEESEQKGNGRKLWIAKNVKVKPTDSDCKRYRRGGNEKIEWEKNDAKISGRGFQIKSTDYYCERIQRFKQEKIQRKQGFSWCQNVRRIEDLQGRPSIPEPLIRRKDYGVSKGLDKVKLARFDRIERTKAIGNAVVPDCAEFLGEYIMEKEVEKE